MMKNFHEARQAEDDDEEKVRKKQNKKKQNRGRRTDRRRKRRRKNKKEELSSSSRKGRTVKKSAALVGWGDSIYFLPRRLHKLLLPNGIASVARSKSRSSRSNCCIVDRGSAVDKSRAIALAGTM